MHDFASPNPSQGGQAVCLSIGPAVIAAPHTGPRARALTAKGKQLACCGLTFRTPTTAAERTSMLSIDSAWETLSGLQQELSFGNPTPWLNLHFYLEFFFLGVIMYVVTRRMYSPKKKSSTLTEEEIDARCAAWKPVPLVPEGSVTKPELVLDKACGATLKLQGDAKTYANFASHNFLGMVGNEEVHDASKAVIEKYGVGSCGPRGFYGSIDVHINCEEEIAKFMGVDHAILYSYDVATPSSVIPAFSKGGDLIIADERVNFSIKTGLHLCKSAVVFYKHNDMADLEAKLEDVMARDKKNRGKINRRFIVCEGIYQNLGDIAPLPKLVELKNKYKFRLILDESMSVGTLGQTGRGLTEHFNVPIGEVDILCASMSNSVASVGGFCVGDYDTIKHQRLSGAAYCFSASLPPYLSQASISSLRVIDREPQRVVQLQANAQRMRTKLAKLDSLGLHLLGSKGEADDVGSVSPLVHLRLDELDDSSRYQAIVDAVKKSGSIISAASYTVLEVDPPPPSLRLSVCAAHTEKQIDECVGAIEAALKST
jgi:serine palmitoyltransferase